MKKFMDHGKYPRSLRKKSIEALRFTIKDAQAAMDAMPMGINAGYYQDEVLYCLQEIMRRRERGLIVNGELK